MDKDKMAFPQSMSAGSMAIAEGGLTMRDWFAGMALSGMTARGDLLASDLPRAAYLLADMMMAAREAKS